MQNQMQNQTHKDKFQNKVPLSREVLENEGISHRDWMK